MVEFLYHEPQVVNAGDVIEVDNQEEPIRTAGQLRNAIKNTIEIFFGPVINQGSGWRKTDATNFIFTHVNEYLNNNNIFKEEDNTMNANNFMNNMFGKLAPGMCRLSMNGGIAVKTNNGYKTYNTKTGRLTNCSNFVFDIGEDFFFLIPTNRVHKGDIILVSGKPKCVVDVKDNAITVINYEDSTIDTILPERHVFMGNTYFYGRIISMFGDSFKSGKKDGMNNIFKYMMMSEMMKGNSGNSGGMGNLLPLMMMGNGGFENMFDGMFDFDGINIDDDTDKEEESESEE